MKGLLPMIKIAAIALTSLFALAACSPGSDAPSFMQKPATVFAKSTMKTGASTSLYEGIPEAVAGTYHLATGEDVKLESNGHLVHGKKDLGTAYGVVMLEVSQQPGTWIALLLADKNKVTLERGLTTPGLMPKEKIAQLYGVPTTNWPANYPPEAIGFYTIVKLAPNQYAVSGLGIKAEKR